MDLQWCIWDASIFSSYTMRYGSLAVVLRERGFLNRALIAARCSESLSDEGPARARAQARREDLERRVGAPRLPSPDEAARAEVEGSPSLPPPPLPLRRVASARGESTGLSGARGQPGGAAVAASRAQGAVVPARFRHAARVAAVAGAVLLVGAGATYFLARSRSNDFQTEQTEHGYTQRARDLHDSAVSWQNVTTIGLGAGSMLVGASTAVLMF